MNIPNLPTTELLTEEGKIHPSWNGVLSQLIAALQNNLSNNGYLMPQQDTSTINQLNTSRSIGALIYDSDTNQLKVNINGTFKVVQTL